MKCRAASVLVSVALVTGCVSGRSDLYDESRNQVLIGHMVPTDEVLVFEPGGDAGDHWTVYFVEPVANPGRRVAVLGYDGSCPETVDADAIYRLKTQLRAAIVMNRGKGEQRNQWFIVSCERLQEEERSEPQRATKGDAGS